MKYLLGEASHWEEEAVRHWIELDTANQHYLDQFKLIGEASRQQALVSTADENKAWERFRQRVDSGKIEQPVPAKQVNFSWQRMAAAIVIVAGIAFISYVIINKARPDNEQAVEAQQTIVNDTLPDAPQLP